MAARVSLPFIARHAQIYSTMSITSRWSIVMAISPLCNSAYDFNIGCVPGHSGGQSARLDGRRTMSVSGGGAGRFQSLGCRRNLFHTRRSRFSRACSKQRICRRTTLFPRRVSSKSEEKRQYLQHVPPLPRAKP